MSRSMPGKLYLIPNVIADDTQNVVITAQVRNELPHIAHFLAEDIRTARRYLSSLKIYESIEPLHFGVLNKDTKPQELEQLFEPITQGHDMGVISESGCPGVADPGALAVKYAHDRGIRVVPLVGPSSLLLALMASGLNGQRFAFQGYLPIDAREAAKAVKEFEKESRQKNQTQLFIETPYRNNAVFEVLLKNLNPETLLCVAVEVTGKEESILTQPVSRWRKTSPTWPKAPAIFLFLAI
ncbi:SAM-dependent methyltransferase [Chryseolinea soli]|nr:SAM-dependent methyltransferase [Chryseolinea soli]